MQEVASVPVDCTPPWHPCGAKHDGSSREARQLCCDGGGASGKGGVNRSSLQSSMCTSQGGLHSSVEMSRSLQSSTDMSRSSLHSSVESIGAEDSPVPALSARQDPPGQEHPVAEVLSPHPVAEGKMQWEAAYRHGDCLRPHPHLRLVPLGQCGIVTSTVTPTVFRANENVPAIHQYCRYEPAMLPPKAYPLSSMPSPPAHRIMPEHVVAKGWEPCMSRQVHMEELLWENERLRTELEAHQDVNLTIQRLEQELRQVCDAYGQLMQSCSDKEEQEDQQRALLLQEIGRLQQLNTTLKDSLEETNQKDAEEVELADQHQHQMIALITQGGLKQQECVYLQRELRLMRVRWYESRLHACALERALVVSRQRGALLRSELQTQWACADAARRLQGALSRLESSCMRREEVEKELRTQLQDTCARREEAEKELRAQLQQQQMQQQQSTQASESLALVTGLVEQKDAVISDLQEKLTRLQNLKSIPTSNDDRPTVTSVHTETESTDFGSLPLESAAASTQCNPTGGTDSQTQDSKQQQTAPLPDWIEGLDSMEAKAAELFI